MAFPDKANPALSPGLYERLLDQELFDLLGERPELIPLWEKLDDECEAHAYSQFISQVLNQVLPGVSQEHRIGLINRIVELLGAQDGHEYTLRKRLLSKPQTLLRQLRLPGNVQPLSTPETPLNISSLLTGAAEDPPLERELRTEMLTADRIDILVSFIKWSGLSLLLSAFEELERNGIPVRIITTSYMGGHPIPMLSSGYLNGRTFL